MGNNANNYAIILVDNRGKELWKPGMGLTGTGVKLFVYPLSSTWMTFPCLLETLLLKPDGNGWVGRWMDDPAYEKCHPVIKEHVF